MRDIVIREIRFVVVELNPFLPAMRRIPALLCDGEQQDMRPR
jgi:hypothetical protein